MAGVVFIGDELTATGLRLAGIEVIMPAAANAAAAIEQARSEASVVLVSSSLARQVPGAILQAALLAVDPLVVVVPEITGASPLPDLGRRLKATLGIEG
ncbi:MAG: hypothetical protein F9K29_22245 [Hyphomicrobiaceae bacterium]|nr:MAG: hypothetical protein F9K29_22245 [Hyphomicrobiaceae bacterium]